MSALPFIAADVADLERRFGGLRRLYGAAGYQAVRTARIAVVGLGGHHRWRRAAPRHWRPPHPEEELT